MNLGMRQEGLRRVVTAQVPPDESGSYEEKMLLSCRSGLLIPVLPGNEDGKKMYEYEVSGLIRIPEYLEENGAGAGAVRRIVDSFCRVSSELEEFLLSPDSLTLDPDYLFWDPEDERLKFIYIPGFRGDFLEGIRGFTAELLEYTDYEDMGSVLLVYEFYKTVRAPEFRIKQLEKLKIREDAGEAAARDCEEDFVFTAGSGMPEEAAEDAAREREKRLPVFRKESLGRTGAVISVCLAALLFYETGITQRLFGGLSGAGAKVFTVCLMAAGCAAVILIQKQLRQKAPEGSIKSRLVALSGKHGIIRRKDREETV
ncbi:MAG: DUF6382 domain-containing protein [Lachnospiraceae bacterium]|nr:DUF6382 domain-containing protein [Lachnospiraceae bacterium]